VPLTGARGGLEPPAQAGFLLLEERQGTEILFGQTPDPGSQPPPTATTPRHRTGPGHRLHRPRICQDRLSIRVEPCRTRQTLVITETHTATTNARSRRRFAVYFKLIGPISALIRRLVLGW
jgi:hypothetical protein